MQVSVKIGLAENLFSSAKVPPVIPDKELETEAWAIQPGFWELERGVSVSQLNDLKIRIEQKIKADGLDEIATKGKIGLRAGKLLAFITPSTPDDATLIANLKLAAREILNYNL